MIPLEIAPLRERREDIEELTLHFARRYAQLFKKDFWKITDDVMERLKSYEWKGNVRELENVTEFMVNMMGPNGILDTGTLPRELRCAQPARQTRQAETACREQASVSEGTILPLKELEQREIRRAMAKYGTTTQGKIAAAKELGIGLATLYRKLGEIGM